MVHALRGGVVEIEVDEDSVTTPSSIAGSSSCSVAAVSTASPRKLRRLARETFILPIPFYTERLPDSEAVTMLLLLAWHAGDMVRKNNWQDKPTRRRTKSACLLPELCVLLAKNPLAVVPLPPITGKDRVYASHIAAKVMASAYDWSVRRAREGVSALWPSTPQDVKNKWFLLSTHPEYNDQWIDPSVPEVHPDTAAPVEAVGAMFTWQTSIGRCGDRVQGWVRLGLASDTLCDLMKGDAELKSHFEAFSTWVSNMCEAQGFVHWSAGMEVCPSLQDAVVHLHAYVCVNWRAASRRNGKKGRADRDTWKYGSFRPDVNPTTVKGNANVQKILTQGLFYCMVEKIGGLFRASNVEAGKDRSVTVCSPPGWNVFECSRSLRHVLQE